MVNTSFKTAVLSKRYLKRKRTTMHMMFMEVNVKKITEKKSHKKAEYKKIYRNYCLSLITEKPKYSVKNKPNKLLFSSSFSFSLNI